MTRSPYIVGPRYDWACFLLPPVLSLLLGIALSDTWLASASYQIGTEDDTAIGFFIGTVIHAHLLAVVFRSHGNPDVRRRHPIRFLLVPPLLYLAIVASPWIAAATTVVATFWDVWHSGAQTFGFARIYERNHGTPPTTLRRLDFWLHQLIYAGPILAGATLMDHVESFSSFEKVGDAFFSSVPATVSSHTRFLTYAILSLASAFLVLYIAAYWRLSRRGYRPPWLKIYLVTSTAFVSIYSWGFNSWGQAFLIMNLFHGIQYLALVWAMEGKRIAPRLPRPLAFSLYLAPLLVYGFAVQLLDPSLTSLWAFTMVVSLMHFWYDAFVWSVRRSQI